MPVSPDGATGEGTVSARFPPCQRTYGENEEHVLARLGQSEDQLRDG